MGTTTKLNGTLRKFIEKQPMFFVATAAHDGRVNVSPKGMDTLRVIDDAKIMWLNLSGSGNETAAHVRECPRMTLMFCAFDGPPMILRVYGTPRVFHPRSPEWPQRSPLFPKVAGSRQIFELDIDLVQTSCGTGVPEMQLVRSRGEEELAPYYADLGPDGVRQFWEKKNTQTLDGKPTGIFSDE